MRTAKQHLVKSLRRNSTDAEKKLWRRLRTRQLADCKFRRQRSYGPYILDFYCAEAKLAIELDGDPHGMPGRVERDVRRDAFLRGQGLTVLRFWNFQAMQEFDGVLETIFRTLKQHPLTQTLSLGGERGEQQGAPGPTNSAPLGGEDQGEGS